MYKSLVCIKFVQIVVIFPESSQTFNWGEAKIPGTLNVEARRKLFWKTLKNTQI